MALPKPVDTSHSLWRFQSVPKSADRLSVREFFEARTGRLSSFFQWPPRSIARTLIAPMCVDFWIRARGDDRSRSVWIFPAPASNW